jgi:hypothetical protein
MELPCLSNKKIKHITELTDDELFNQLDESENSEISELENVQIIQTPILDFIKKFDIKSGKYRVPVKALSILYKKTMNDSRINQFSFINKMRQYFRIVDNMIYINKSAFHYHAELEILLNKKRKVRITTEAFTKHVIKFLEDTAIKKGPIPVPCFVLYHIYKQYCYRIKRLPMAKINFYLFADKLWDKTTTQHGESYLVNNKGDLYHVKEYKKIQKIYEKKQKTVKRTLKKK